MHRARASMIAAAGVVALALLAAPAPARAGLGGLMSFEEGGPIVRLVVGGTGGGALLKENDESRWSWAAGAGLELSLAATGLSPLLQAGYLATNELWHHALPVDVGGRYLWDFGMAHPYVSAGMSVFIMDKKTEDAAGATQEDWEVYPLVYFDAGVRLMFKRHLGLELRAEVRTYVVTTVIGLKIGLAI